MTREVRWIIIYFIFDKIGVWFLLLVIPSGDKDLAERLTRVVMVDLQGPNACSSGDDGPVLPGQGPAVRDAVRGADLPVLPCNVANFAELSASTLLFGWLRSRRWSRRRSIPAASAALKTSSLSILVESCGTEFWIPRVRI